MTLDIGSACVSKGKHNDVATITALRVDYAKEYWKVAA